MYATSNVDVRSSLSMQTSVLDRRLPTSLIEDVEGVTVALQLNAPTFWSAVAAHRFLYATGARTPPSQSGGCGHRTPNDWRGESCCYSDLQHAAAPLRCIHHRRRRPHAVLLLLDGDGLRGRRSPGTVRRCFSGCSCEDLVSGCGSRSVRSWWATLGRRALPRVGVVFVRARAGFRFCAAGPRSFLRAGAMTRSSRVSRSGCSPHAGNR